MSQYPREKTLTLHECLLQAIFPLFCIVYWSFLTTCLLKLAVGTAAVCSAYCKKPNHRKVFFWEGVVTYLTLFLFCHMFNLTVTVPCLTPPLPTVTVPWRCTSAPPSLMTEPHPSSTSSLLSSLLSTNGPLLKERKKKKRLAYFVLCDVVIRGPRSVTETNHLMERYSMLHY